MPFGVTWWTTVLIFVKRQAFDTVNTWDMPETNTDSKNLLFQWFR